MNHLLSPPIRRATALGLLVLALLLLWTAVIEPISRYWTSTEGDVSQLSGFVARYREIASQEGALQRQLIQLGHAPKSNVGLFEGQSKDLALAAFQTVVRDLLTRNGARIQSIRPLSVTPESDLQRLGLQLLFYIPLKELRSLFVAIESNPTYIFVDNVDMQGNQTLNVGAAGAPPYKTIELAVHCSVYGYWKGKP